MLPLCLLTLISYQNDFIYPEPVCKDCDRLKMFSTNQKHCPDLGSDVISRGNQW